MVHPLDAVNLTELIEMCRAAGLGNLGRNSSRKTLYAALENGVVESECPLEPKRVAMEIHIGENFRRLRTQLPGCSGKCVSYGCPDIIVERCWSGFKEDMV